MNDWIRRQQRALYRFASDWRDHVEDGVNWVTGARRPKYRHYRVLRAFRHVNLRRLAGVGLVILGAVALTALLHRFQVRWHAVDLLTHVARCEQSGDLAGVDRYLYRYVQLVPNDTAALIRLSQLRFQRAKTPRAKLAATSLLSRALSREPERDDERFTLAQQYFELGRYADASAHLRVLLKNSPPQKETIELFAQSEAKRAKYVAAAEAYGTAIELDASYVPNYVALAELLYRHLSRLGEAEQVLDQAVANNPRSVDALLARARFRLKDRARSASRADVQAALELDAGRVDSLKLAAEIAIGDLQYESAHEFLDRAFARGTEDSDVYLLRSKLHQAELHNELAIEAIHEGIRKLGPQADLLGNLAELLSEAGQWEEVQQIIDSLRDTGVATDLVNYLRGGLLFDRGLYLEAARIYEGILASGGEHSDVEARTEFHLAGCYHMMGQLDEAISRYHRTKRLRPTWPNARWNLATELAITGRFEESLNECEVACALTPPTAPQWALYLKLLVWRERTRPPAEQAWDSCERVLKLARAAWSDVPVIRIAACDLLAAQGKFQESIELLTEAVQVYPNEMELRVAWAALLDRIGETEQAGRVLDEAVNALGDSVMLRLARANRLEEDESALEALRALGTGIEQSSPSDQIALLRGLGYACLRRGHFELAQHYIEQLAERADYDLGCRLLLADLAVRTGDEDRLSKCLDQIRTIEGPRGVLWRYGEASRIRRDDEPVASRSLQRAWELLREARAVRRASDKVYLNIGRVDELQDRPDRALDAYHFAFELSDYQTGRVATASE